MKIKKFLICVLVLMVLFEGCVGESEDIGSTEYCTYNVEYNSRDECVCDGAWRGYTNFSNKCVDREIKNICRRIENNVLANELLITFNENVSLINAKELINQQRYMILEYTCDFNTPERNRMIIDAGDDLEKAITNLENQSIISSARKNRLTRGSS